MISRARILVTLNGGDESTVGGVVGLNSGQVSQSQAQATIGGALFAAGGLVGDNAGGSLDGDSASGQVVSIVGAAGGLVGMDETPFDSGLIPIFYPAGSTSAQAELTYRFGFDAICNTEPLRALQAGRYGGEAIAFTPQLDRRVFHPPADERRWPRARVFFYARPENPRNAFELSAAALKRLKHRLGASVEILCAGADFDPKAYGLDGVVEPLGWLPYEETGELYRTCHVGLTSMLTPHPSYLPFELMACGALVVALRNPANEWLLQDGVTCLVADATASELEKRLFDAVTGWDELAAVRANAARAVVRHAGRGWAAELAGVVDFMMRPAPSARARDPATVSGESIGAPTSSEAGLAG